MISPCCERIKLIEGTQRNKGYQLKTRMRSEKIVSMIRKYHNHKPQTTPWHLEEEPLNHNETPGRQIKQSNQLSLPHQDDCNTRMDVK